VADSEWPLDWMVSVDDHVIEPSDLWQSRVPAPLRDRAPRRVTDDGGEAWLYAGDRYPTYGLNAVAGKSAEEFGPEPVGYEEMRPGCYEPRARVEDMNRDHVIASLCFPSFARFAGQLFSLTPDRELGIACIRAYNDWMLEEWTAAAPGRLLPLVIAPMWDPALAAAEVERCAAKGAKALAFSENPQPLGFPSIHDIDYWHPLFSTANDAGLPLCSHIGSSSTFMSPTPDAPPLARVTYAVMAASAGTMISWLFGGHFLRYPSLKLCLSEGGIGWMPHALERAEHVYDKQRHWTLRSLEPDFKGRFADGAAINMHQAAVDMLRSGIRPTELFRGHVYGCFFSDEAGLEQLDRIGEDNVMVESDYPHSDSSWPNTMKVIGDQLRHLPAPTQRKILQQNAMRVYNFTPPPPSQALGHE